MTCSVSLCAGNSICSESHYFDSGADVKPQVRLFSHSHSKPEIITLDDSDTDEPVESEYLIIIF